MILVARNGRAVVVEIITNVPITIVEAVGETATVVVTTVEVVVETTTVVATTVGVEATTTALTLMLATGETTEVIEDAFMVGPSLMPRVSR